MMVNPRHWALAAVLLFAGASCTIPQHYMDDVALPEAMNRAYIVATAGLIWTCSGLLNSINSWYISELPEKLFDSSSELTVMMARASRMIGVVQHFTAAVPTVVHVEGLLKNDTLLRKLKHADAIEELEKVMRGVRAQVKAVEALCADEDAKCSTSAPVAKCDWYFYVEFPKIWLGPLQMIYNALKLNDPKIQPAKLFVTRLQEFGSLQFQNTRHVNVIKTFATTFYQELFKKSATGVVQDLFEAIHGAVDSEQRALLQPLFDLYYMSLDFRNIS